MNAIQRDRMERRRNTRRKSMVSTAIFAVVVVAVLAAIIFGVVALVGKNKNNAEPTQAATVGATIASGAAPTQPAATQLPSTNAELQRPQATTASSPADPAWQSSETTGSGVSQQETTASGSSSTSSQGSYINDDNVYIDRNHPAPEKTGESAEFRFNGAVDGNFYWNYDADNGNIVVSCDYDFTNQQYIFHFYGAEPGVSHVTLYCSDNGVTVPVDLTVNVDDALNVTVG
jgi:hypothetical protein